MLKNNSTRGYGLFENYLARKRAGIANHFIPEKFREGKILDIGCGSTPYFLINTRFREKHGIDPSLRNIYLKKDIKLKKFDIEDNSKLPFPADYFDVVTMLAVIEHIEPGKMVQVLREIRRVLRPGGRFIMTTPAKFANKILKIMSIFKLISSKEFEEHKILFDNALLSDYMERAGFERKQMRFGSFEVFMNIWGYADK